MARRLGAALVALLFWAPVGAAPAQEVTDAPVRAGIMATLLPDGSLVLEAGDRVELENGMVLQRDSAGAWRVAGTFVRLALLAADPFRYNGQRVTVTGGFIANVLPEYGFFQYSNLAEGATITVLTEGVPANAIEPYAAACAGFITDTNSLCGRSVLGTVNVNEADGSVELIDPVIVTP